MQIRRGTLAAWGAAGNPLLLAGELGFVTDVGLTAFKIGDGSTGWDTLPYVNSTYPELLVTGGTNLDLAVAQGRYSLLSVVTYTSSPALPSEYAQGVTDGDSILTVTVPSSGIVIQQINTSLTAKQFLRARNGSTWTAWKRIDTLAATDSLSITNLTLTGTLTLPIGLPATPSLTFTSDTNTGIYSSGGDNLSITTNGSQRVAVGNTLTTVTTPLTVTGVVTATVSGSADALIVTGTGVSKLKSTIVDGLVQISPGGANKFSVGSTRSGTFGLTEIYGNSSPYLKVMPTTAAAATDLIWTGTNAAGSPTTTIQCNGVPTTATDLTTKSYVDTQVAGVTFREIMIIATTSTTDGNYVVGGTVVTGVISGGTAIRLFLLGAVPTFTFVSNVAASTVTWSNFSSGGRAHLVPSAGTWSVSCPAGGTNLTFTAIRTA